MSFAAEDTTTEKEYIYLPLALSIVPQVSLVEYEPNEVPHLSFNLLAGYYAKLDGFELGGLANLETEEVYGVQIAGLTNVVGGRVKGFPLHKTRGSCVLGVLVWSLQICAASGSQACARHNALELS